MIPNHIAPRLSALDLKIAASVPPGGNWKNIPESIPSKRLEQIRESYAAGLGSRSTYYGRLLATKPAYTITTYFTRPGNGCHLHYDSSQNRTLSYREAARLQSFPDSFIFEGTNGSVANQIGNAVPPILAYCLAEYFGAPGDMVDLFSGAGGLTLGFKWAGWRSLVASDIDATALKTLSNNLGIPTVTGDIRNPEIQDSIVSISQTHRDQAKPLLVIGGPPCQGFSTAGNKRSMADERNHLFKEYCRIVEKVDPDAFLFENVPGITNMDGGKVFRQVCKALQQVCDELLVFQVNAHEFGVPQRRKRVVIVGFRRIPKFSAPQGFLVGDLLGGDPVSVEEALSDLPSLKAGEDGSILEYKFAPHSEFQMLMRGCIGVDAYINASKARRIAA